MCLNSNQAESLATKRKSEYRTSRFDLSTNYTIGGQVFPSALLHGQTADLSWTCSAHSLGWLAGSRKTRQSIFSGPLWLSQRSIYLNASF